MRWAGSLLRILIAAKWLLARAGFSYKEVERHPQHDDDMCSLGLLKMLKVHLTHALSVDTKEARSKSAADFEVFCLDLPDRQSPWGSSERKVSG